MIIYEVYCVYMIIIHFYFYFKSVMRKRRSPVSTKKKFVAAGDHFHSMTIPKINLRMVRISVNKCNALLFSLYSASLAAFPGATLYLSLSSAQFLYSTKKMIRSNNFVEISIAIFQITINHHKQMVSRCERLHSNT